MAAWGCFTRVLMVPDRPNNGTFLMEVAKENSKISALYAASWLHLADVSITSGGFKNNGYAERQMAYMFDVERPENQC